MPGVRIGTGTGDFAVGRWSPFWDGLLSGNSPSGAEDAPASELGLIQAYGVVAGHGGDVFLEGDEMVIALPVLDKRKDMQALHNLDDTRLLGTETILLVDDEDMIWDVIIDMLQELGYSVVLAENGRDAVEIYRANPGQIDLVLLDMVMPEVDGHQAFFMLQEIDPDVCVLLSSGYVSEDDAREVLDAGAQGFLQKPYKMVDLARKMRQIFEARRAEAGA